MLTNCIAWSTTANGIDIILHPFHGHYINRFPIDRMQTMLVQRKNNKGK